MNFKNIFVDTRKSGIDQFILTGVTPWMEYKDGKRTDKRLGTSYIVALKRHFLDKITVHVKNDENSVAPKMQEVKFTNLQVTIYPDYRNPRELGVKATADAIQEVKHE